MTEIYIFIFSTLGLVWFSWWFSIRDKRYHGIYRFFAFEAILALFLLNYPVWFADPFSLQQFISWFVLLISMIYLIYGAYLFFKFGKPEGKVENTTNLVTTGLYKYIRHPLYGSLWLLGFGIYLKNLTLWTSLLILINIIALHLTAKAEEKEMLGKFGDEYKSYMQKSRMFIPFIY
jgi:protein-S-isoprenylcysteine O-methyltransferase Ste14